ncbi:hypothetical protein [Micromonospora haikouensis]|uniref:hypothetical protein n=1 Tax=Micromonospora haikouensis TaxID=686309 RepID=UPI003D741976
MPPPRRRNAGETPAAVSPAGEKSAKVEPTESAAGPLEPPAPKTEETPPASEPSGRQQAGEREASPLEPPSPEPVDTVRAAPGGRRTEPGPVEPPTRNPAGADGTESGKTAVLDPPSFGEVPVGSEAVLDSPVAPLTPPAQPATPQPPAPAQPALNGERLGYVDDNGKPIRIADVFDLSGNALMVPAKTRVHTRFRRPGVRTVLQSLLYPQGAQVHRTVATALIAEEQTAEQRTAGE